MGRGIALLTFIVGGLIIADLWSHASVTNKFIGAGSKTASLLAGK